MLRGKRSDFGLGWGTKRKVTDHGRTSASPVEGEHLLAEHEALAATLKRQGIDVSEAESALEMIRLSQRRREQDRQRLLSLLHP